MSNTSKKNIHIIGAGKLGKSLAKDIVAHELGHIISISNRSAISSQQVINELYNSISYSPIDSLASADIIFITTPDTTIKQCANQLSQNVNILPGTIIAHCSGVMSAEVLSALKDKGCFICAMHPIRSFSKAHQPSFAHAYTAIEGDNQAISTIQDLLAPLALRWLYIDGTQKASYHSGSVFAANYLISILHQAQKHYQQAGIDEAQALNICCDLAQSALDNIKSTHNLQSALTGPLARGDIDTLSQHLSPMQEPTKKLYQQLALNLLELCELPERKVAQIIQLLTE